MKTLKKTLCLVLAVIMAVGVLVLPAAAADDDAFTDAAKIKPEYRQAVDVLNLLEVLQGNPDGSFAPNGTLTRAQAAMIAVRIVLKPDGVVGLPKNATGFTDVAAGHYAAGAIGYAHEYGIVDGNPDGTFAPEGLLTRDQFAKMLLIAMGINGSYTGIYWQTNVYVKARNAGLLDGIEDVDGNDLLTREQAAQMALNAIINPRRVTVWDEKTQTWVETNGGANGDNYQDPLIETVFGLNPGSSEDDYGRPTSVYKKGTKTLIEVADAYSEIFENTAKKGKDLKTEDITTVYENGTDSAIADDTDYGGKGSVIEVYSDRIVVIDTYVGTLGEVKDGKATVGESDEYEVEVGSLKKGDVYIYTHGEKEATVKAPESIDGVITATNKTSGYVRLDGVRYLSKHAKDHDNDATVGAKNLTVNAEVTVYLDDYGNIIYVGDAKAPEAASLNYIYVIEGQAKGANEDNGKDLFGEGGTSASDAAAKARVLFLDGTGEQVIDLAVIKSGDDWYYANAKGKPIKTDKVETEAKTTVGEFYTCVKTDLGYVLTKLESLDEVYNVETADQVTVEKGKALVKYGTGNQNNRAYGTSGSVLTVITHSGTTYKVVTYNSYKNFVDISKTSDCKVVVDVNDSSNIRHLIVLVEGELQQPVTDYKNALYVGEGESTEAGTEYTFIVDGKEVTYVGDESLESKTVYNIEVDGTTLKSADPAEDAKVASATEFEQMSDDGAYIVVSSDTYYLSSDCVMIDASGSSITVVDEVPDGAEKIALYWASSAKSEINLIVFLPAD